MQPYQLAALVLSCVCHLWLGHALALGGIGHHEQKPTPASMSNILTVQLSQAAIAPTHQNVIPAPAEGPKIKSSLPLSGQIDGDPMLPVSGTLEPYYFRTHELTNPPVLLQDVLATQNLDLSNAPTKLVVLRLLVGENGEMDRVEVEDTNLSEKATQFLVEKFSKMKFEPGKIDNIPVRSQLTIEVELDTSK